MDPMSMLSNTSMSPIGASGMMNNDDDHDEKASQNNQKNSQMMQQGMQFVADNPEILMAL